MYGETVGRYPTMTWFAGPRYWPAYMRGPCLLERWARLAIPRDEVSRVTRGRRLDYSVAGGGPESAEKVTKRALCHAYAATRRRHADSVQFAQAIPQPTTQTQVSVYVRKQGMANSNCAAHFNFMTAL